jgi:TolA-binding protein
MRSLLTTVMIAAASLAIVAPAHAQDRTVDARLGQLEKRMNTVERAVSRTSGPLVQPEIGPDNAPVAAPGTPASAPLADLEQRVSSVESELAGFTGRLETDEHKLQQLEGDFAAYKRATDARLKALEDRAAPPPGDADPAAVTDGPAPGPVRPGARPPAGAGAGTSPAPRPAPAANDPDRAKAVAAIPKPAGKDAVDKAMYAYNYAYRLWQAKYYPEAEAQLQGYGAKFPGHRLVSRAQNLLGTIYMDDGKPNLAAQIYYENYSKLPDGERAADSLLNLAKALTVLKKPRTDICRVYSELGDVYGAKLTAAQKADADKGRAANKCT